MTTLLLSDSINPSPLLTIPLFPGRWASPPNATAVVRRRASRFRTAGSRFRFLPLVALAGFILLVATLPPAFGVGYEGPVGVTGIFNGNITTACSYDPLSHNAKRTVTDIVVPGSVGKYPLKMTRYYNSRLQNGAEGLGIGWTHEYSWILTEGVSKLITPQGNVYDYFCQSNGQPVGISEYWESGPDTNGNGTFRMADGGRVVFLNHAVSSITDPYGLTTTITRDTFGRTWKVIEPGTSPRYLQFIYYTSGPWLGMLQTVEAHDGQGHTTDSVNYTYQSVPSGGIHFGPSLMLTGVGYSDNTSATYQYEGDNVPDDFRPPWYNFRMYPLLNYCYDVRYNGPMREIAYFYQGGGPHGAIFKEKNPTVGPISTIAPGIPVNPVNGALQTTFTETRGDGPTRSFTYTAFRVNHAGESDPCADVENNNPPHQMLLQYTDFRNQSTYLGYDPNWYVNSVTDANLHTTSYQRGLPPPQGIGEILRITHPGDGSTIIYTYDPDPHYVVAIKNERQPSGYTTYYRRDASHRVYRIDYPDTSFEAFTYNNFGQVLTNQMRNGAYERFAYDSRGLLTDKWNPQFGHVPLDGDPHTHYTYYTAADGTAFYGWIDRVKTETLPANINGLQASATYEYDRNAGVAVAGRGLVTKITHADAKYQSFGYDIFGNKLWEENELRNHTDYAYDSYNRLTTVTRLMTPPDPNEITTYDYSPVKGDTTRCYFHTTASVYFVTDPMIIVTANGYDPNFRKTSTTQGYGSSSPATTWFHYDNVGNQDYVTDPRGSSTPSASWTTYTNYDSRNRKIQVSEPLGHVTQFFYEDGINLTRIIRPDTTTETKTYDTMNQMWTDTVPRTSATDLITTTFVYNLSGTINTVRDGNNHETTFAYNPANLKITMTYPNSSDYQSWTYDDANNLATRRTVHGEIQSFSYDNRNRQTHMGWSNNVDASDFGYDDASRLTSANNGYSAVTRIYDDAGRMTHDIQNVLDIGPLDVQYTRDADGRVTRMMIPGGIYDQSRGYNDPLGRLSAIWDMYRPNMIQYQYDAASNITERDTILNTSSIIYTPDNLNRIARRQVKLGTTTISDETYGYDPMSRLTTVDRTEDGSHDQFGYYLDGELSSAQYTTRSVAYTLDKAGNRTNVNDTGTNTTYTPNNLNQYGNVGIDRVTNGSEHEIASYQNVSYNYINDTHLQHVTFGNNTYDLAYDALGRCVKRTLTVNVAQTTTYYFYDGEKPIQEGRPGVMLASTIYGIGIDEPAIRFTQAVVYYFYQDHEGSVTHVAYSNAQGSGLIEQYRYDAFGAPTIRDGHGQLVNPPGVSAIGNRFMFTGREWAPVNVGFYEYRARAYHPGLGRFMSEDPKLFDAGDYNLFRYCHNDPEDLTDPMGLIFGVDDAILAGSGALVGLGAQGLADLLSGHPSGWEAYVGAGLGGAIGGLATEWVGPFAPAAGSAAANAITQGLRNTSGAQHGFNTRELITDTAVGQLTGVRAIPLGRLNTGRNSFSAIAKQIHTKFENGAIQHATAQTAAKAVVGSVAAESGHMAAEAATHATARSAEPSGGESGTSAVKMSTNFGATIHYQLNLDGTVTHVVTPTFQATGLPPQESR
jgi:RHS repeat-associated protein